MANNPQYTGMQPHQHHVTVHAVPPLNPIPHMPMQYRPGVPPPAPQPQTFTPVPPQQFQHTGHSSMGMPPPHPPLQYPQAGPPPPPPPPRPQGPQPLGQPQMSVTFMPSFGGPRIFPPSYPLSSSSIGHQQSSVGPTSNIPHYTTGGQPWYPNGNQTMQAIVPPQQALEQSGGGQPWFSTVNQSINSVTPLQQSLGPNDVAQQSVPIGSENVQSDMPSQKTEEQSEKTKSDSIKNAPLEWKEYTSRAGKRYYYNKRTKVSSWEKPLEMMTPNERADATTEWREYTISDGRKFYYNKLTKISNWKIPNEVQLARAKENMSICEGTPTIKDIDLSTPNDKTNSSLSIQQIVSSPDSLTPGSSSTREDANLIEDVTGLPSPPETTTPIAMSTPKVTSDIILSPEAEPSSSNVPSTVEEINKSAGISESGPSKAPEEKKIVYENKEEAKKAFNDLLETANVGSDWIWEQAMRVIINDPRYAALRSLGERKQAFNEFVGEKKKQEAEERRARQIKSREDFKKMLEESKDLTSSTKWSKAVSMFENDERFHAVERLKDREDYFADHMQEVIKKERAKALEEKKLYKAEYMELLKSCDFIQASSQWRKVQQRLEADERCSRLDKIERLEIFQEYIRDLDKEEEELRKIKMDEQRKTERKNRDEFRKLMEEHVANGTITSKSIWRFYTLKVKDEPAYLAVISNTSGSSAKDLFQDVIEDLEKQYAEDKEQIEDAIKFGKISLATNWTIEDFKSAVSKEISSNPISDFNLKRAFDELMVKAKEKDEIQTKRRKRQAEELYDFLINSKEITASSKWEDSKSLIEERFYGDKVLFQEIFDKVIVELKDKAKEERKRRDEKLKKERKDKEKKEKERKHKSKEVEIRKSKDSRRKRSEADSDVSGSLSPEDSRRSRDRGKDRDRNRKYRRRHRDSHDDSSDNSKKSKSKEKPLEADDEGRRKRHKRDYHRDDKEKHKDDQEKQKDEDCGDDVEII